MALMVGFTQPSDGLEGDCPRTAVSSHVGAVINMAGTADAVATFASHPTHWKRLMGGTPEEMPARYRAASPIAYVHKDVPPVLTICGSEDSNLRTAKALDKEMKSVGAAHTLFVVDGALTHRYPIVDLANDAPVWEFLDANLRK
jgi:acetyl esterase/lipase